MLTLKSAVKLAIVCGVLILPIAGRGYAEDEPTISKKDFYVAEMANSFEEALGKDERLRERYGAATPEQQQQMQERWQARKEKWDSMSDEQKEAMKEKMQKGRAKWESMTDEGKEPGRQKKQKSWWQKEIWKNRKIEEK